MLHQQEHDIRTEGGDCSTMLSTGVLPQDEKATSSMLLLQAMANKTLQLEESDQDGKGSENHFMWDS